jgi:hypothetical protein
MLDAAVGVDKIAESPCHVAIQTCGTTSHSTACQTSITTNNTCAVQTDGTASADSITHPEEKLSNCRLSEEEPTCSINKKQKVETELSREVDAETEIQTQSAADSGILMHNDFKSSLKGTEKVNLLSVTSHNSAERKLKKQSSMVRYDYKKLEKCSKRKVRKWGSLTPPSCSDKSDDSSDEDFPLRSKGSSTPAPATCSCMPTDKLLTQQSTAASSGSFVVEDAPHLLAYPKEAHCDGCLIPVVPHFHHHYMDSLLFCPNTVSCDLVKQSMAGLSKVCCYRCGMTGACANMNRCCALQAGHTHHGLRKYCCLCSSCVNTGQSNHRPSENEVKLQISSTGLTSDNVSAKQVWNKIIDTDDSSSDSNTGEHKMTFRGFSLNDHAVNATYTTQIHSEYENTSSRRRLISTDKQDSSVDAELRRKVATKQAMKRRELAHINSRNCSLRTNEEIENKTSRLGNTNMYLKGNHIQAKNLNNKREGNISSRLRKRRNKHNLDHKKDMRKYLLKKFSLSKQKHRSKLKLKHLRHRHLNGHSEESDTSVMKIRSEVQSNQFEAVECMQDSQVGSYSSQVSTVLQSNLQQKTGAVTERNIHEHSSCMELFSTASDVYPDVEQQSHRTAADIHTIQPDKVPCSVLNKHKRKASDGPADQVESKSKDCASLGRQETKRARTGFVSEKSSDSVIDKDSKATSSILLHCISEPSPEKHITRTYNTATDISLPSTEQASSNQEFKYSTANENCLLLNVRVNARETGKAVGKTHPSEGAGSIRKISKLEKFRRNLIRSKMPSKIALELPEKCLKKRRKTLIPVSETSDAGSKSIRPEVRSLSGVEMKANMSNFLTSVGNHSSSPQDLSTPMGNEKPFTNLETAVPNVANGFVNVYNNLVVDLHLTCKSGTDQIFANTHTVKETGMREEINTEINHAAHVSRNFVSSDTFLGAETPPCSQVSVPMSNIITETSSLLSKVDHIPEVHSDSSLPDKIPETVTVPAPSVSYNENVPEANQAFESMGLAASPHTYLEAYNISEEATKVSSPDTAPERCQAAADFSDVEPSVTVDAMKDEIFPRLCQELTPCPVSPIKDRVVGDLQLKSGTAGSSVTTLDTKQIAEPLVNGLSIKSPKRLTTSSMHQNTDKETAVGKCVVNTSTDMTLFPGCVLQQVLKYYEAENKNHPKKSKSVLNKFKNQGWC